MLKPIFLFLAVCFSVACYSQDFSVPGSEGEKKKETNSKTSTPEADAVEPMEELEQVKKTAVIKIRPASILLTPLAFRVFRTLNGELEVGVSDRVSLSLGLHYYYFNSDRLFPDQDAEFTSEINSFSTRIDAKYYFKKRKSKDVYYTMEGWYAGGYHKFVYESVNFTDPFATDLRGISNVIGFLGGYQWIGTKGFTISPLLGFGAGVVNYTNGTWGIRPDGRLGISIGISI